MARKALIVGAGIGGLAAGIALRREGWDVEVLERGERLEPVGAGLSIWPNAVHALRDLGVGELAAEPAAVPTGGALRRADGTVLATFDPKVIEERYGAPLVGLHRGDLQQGLFDGLGAEHVRLGAQVAELDPAGSVTLTDGSTREADLIVGADGVGSTLRSTLVGDGEAIDSGIVALRGVAEANPDEVLAGEWWGSGTVAGLLALAKGRAYWYVAFRGSTDRPDLERRLAEYGPQLRDIVRRTDPGAVLAHRLCDRAPADSWSKGHATLLGDAAHPMLPFLGQGACSALEDAVALGKAVAVNEDVTEAIGVYEAVRTKRTAKLQRGSRGAAKGALADSAPARALRNFAVGHMPDGLRLRQLDGFLGRGPRR